MNVTNKSIDNNTLSFIAYTAMRFLYGPTLGAKLWRVVEVRRTVISLSHNAYFSKQKCQIFFWIHIQQQMTILIKISGDKEDILNVLF